MPIISCKAAKAAGLKHYFTGKPCPRGHIAKRFVVQGCCMECARENAKKHYQSLDRESRQSLNRERSAYQKHYRDTHKEKIAALSAAHRKRYKVEHPNYFREHYAKNRERRRVEANEWYYANTERALQNRREYAAKNPEREREWGRRCANTRRARKRKAFVEVVDPGTVFVRDKGICGICKKPVDVKSNWEIDHVMPLCKGGAHSYDNVQLAHHRCNRTKSAKLPSGQATLFQLANDPT